jgi:hypothetical protein
MRNCAIETKPLLGAVSKERISLETDFTSCFVASDFKFEETSGLSTSALTEIKLMTFFWPVSHCILDEVRSSGFTSCVGTRVFFTHEILYYIFQCLANIKNVTTRLPHHTFQLCFTHKLVFSSHDIIFMAIP